MLFPGPIHGWFCARQQVIDRFFRVYPYFSQSLKHISYITYFRGDPRIVDDSMFGYEEPDSTPNLPVEYSRGVMIVPIWLYGGAQMSDFT